MHVGSLLPRHARYRHDHLAVVCGAHRLTFAEHAARVNRVANTLTRLGLGHGDALAIALPNCMALLELYRACAMLGLVSVPLSPLLRGAALATLLRDSGAKAIVTDATLAAEVDGVRGALPLPAGGYLLASGARDGWRSLDTLATAESDAESDAEPPLAPVAADDPYNIIYSSGTTGEPKGIVHSHRVRAMYGTLFANQFRITPESVVLHAGSLVFNGAFVTLMPAWLLGCTYVLHERFDPEAFIETVAREGVTHVMMVPSQIVAVMNAPNFAAEKLRTLRMLCSVGAPWHREHKERLLPVLRGSLYELYGLTEGFVTVLDATAFESHMDSVGTPVVFSEMRIRDDAGRDLPAGEVGEITGRSPIMMSGYHGRPDLTAQAVRDGWLFTGDLGFADADGYLHLVDRKKDLIISGGANVYPKDIEEVLVQHPAVREVAVFGAPDERWGEIPVAAVILREPGSVEAEALKAWVNDRVAAKFQRVHAVAIRDDFPRSTAGKTLKRVLREEWAAMASLSAGGNGP